MLRIPLLLLLVATVLGSPQIEILISYSLQTVDIYNCFDQI